VNGATRTATIGHDGENPWAVPHARWNVPLLVLDGFIFALGFNFLSPIAIMPVFVARLTPNDLLAGSFTALEQIGIALPQFVAARWAERAARAGRRRWLKAAANLIGRIPLAIAIAVLVALGDRHPAIVVATVMAAFALLRLCDGSGVPAYYDVVGHAVHPRLRPRYFAWQQAASALGGILSATAARWLLGALPFPWNFAASFSTALVLGIAVAVLFLFVREPGPVASSFVDVAPTPATTPAPPEASTKPWWRTIIAILGDDDRFRRLVLARALVGIAGMAPAYYAVAAVRRLDATDSDAATFGIVVLASQLAGTLAWGEVAARTRRPWFLLGGPLAGAVGASVAILAGSVTGAYLTFVATGIATAAQLMCDMSMPIQLAERAGASRSTYVAAYNMLIIPFSISAPLAGGLLAATAGFDAIDLVGTLAYVAAGFAGLTLVRLLRARNATPSTA
jgi:hypothetical protein